MTDGASAGGFNPDYFERLAEVEDRHFWFTSRNALLERVLAPLAAALPPGTRVLEVGTGNGNTLRAVERACHGTTVVGMDPFVEGLALARRRTSALLVCGSIERLPFRGAFGLVAAFDVLEHVPDDLGALRAVRDQLSPRAHLILTVPAFAHLWSPFDEAAHHCRRYERAQLRRVLEAAGFQIERLTFFMTTLYPALRLSRLVGRNRERNRHAATHERELKIVPGLNALFTALLSVEARAVAAGVQLPFGTSLLAIARRPD